MEPESKSLGSETIGGRDLKRKAEENEEAAAVDVVVVDRLKSEQVLLVRPELEEEVEYEDRSDDYDSDEDPEISLAKIKARFEARVRELDARYPGVTYKDYSIEEDSHDDDDKDKQASV
jgi:hypothetical protein